MLEMLVPALAQAARHWAGRIGPVNVLADEQPSLTDDALAYIADQLARSWGATPRRSSQVNPSAP
ncbi:hypothetical protein [Actinacidiphila bryophytorum]|uniref:hypothetical protein n=1 Tax=Actinacidiphila bryophytorum TaxID=1436133 RepID=UPI002176BE39|nr:hypothetical protein [Actinacidiphila bryophytorum]UWE10197.1 hypothetical protein NYE86_16750 [Actinacidiphila bryophytorum]